MVKIEKIKIEVVAEGTVQYHDKESWKLTLTVLWPGIVQFAKCLEVLPTNRLLVSNVYGKISPVFSLRVLVKNILKSIWDEVEKRLTPLRTFKINKFWWQEKLSYWSYFDNIDDNMLDRTVLSSMNRSKENIYRSTVVVASIMSSQQNRNWRLTKSGALQILLEKIAQNSKRDSRRYIRCIKSEETDF